jgi:hypothetical protein
MTQGTMCLFSRETFLGTDQSLRVCALRFNAHCIFLEERAVDIEGEEDNTPEDDMPLPDNGAGQAGTGTCSRDLVLDWVGEH